MSIVSTILHQLHQMNQWRKHILLGGAIIALVLAFAALLAPLNLANAAPGLQISPLSPLTTTNAASSVTVTGATTATTAGLITSTVVTASEPLPAEVITATGVVTATLAPVEMTSPLTVSTPVEAPTESVATPSLPMALPMGRPLGALWSFPALASGQISLVLVAGLFVGLFTVIGLVLTRRNQ